MKLTIFAAAGGIGRQLVDQAFAAVTTSPQLYAILTNSRRARHVFAIHNIATGVTAVDASVDMLGSGSGGDAARVVLRKFVVSAVVRTSAG